MSLPETESSSFSCLLIQDMIFFHCFVMLDVCLKKELESIPYSQSHIYWWEAKEKNQKYGTNLIILTSDEHGPKLKQVIRTNDYKRPTHTHTSHSHAHRHAPLTDKQQAFRGLCHTCTSERSTRRKAADKRAENECKHLWISLHLFSLFFRSSLTPSLCHATDTPPFAIIGKWMPEGIDDWQVCSDNEHTHTHTQTRVHISR